MYVYLCSLYNVNSFHILKWLLKISVDMHMYSLISVAKKDCYKQKVLHTKYAFERSLKTNSRRVHSNYYVSTDTVDTKCNTNIIITDTRKKTF